MTVHKTQGSEAKVVVFVLNDADKFMLNQQLLYTACTRAKEKLILLGNPTLIQVYCQKYALNRMTFLVQRLQGKVTAVDNLFGEPAA
jgi:exodeoxyribonuclease V alpha subunit